MTKIDKKSLKAKNDEIVDRLMEYLKDNGISLWQLGKDLKMSAGYPYHISNKERKLSANVVEKILEHYPDINKGWLLEGVHKEQTEEEIAQVKRDRSEDMMQTEVKIFELSLRDEIALREKSKLDELYWTSPEFRQNIEAISKIKNITDPEVLAEMAYENADAMIKIRSKSKSS